MRRPSPFRRAAALAAAALVFAAAAARAELPPPELPTALAGDETVAGVDDARALLVNPAATGARYPSELFLAFARADRDHDTFTALGTARRFGWFFQRARGGDRAFGTTVAWGDAPLRFGWAPAWRSGPGQGTVGDHTFGALARPAPWLSAGALVAHALEPKWRGARLPRTWTLGLAVRPLALQRARAHAAGTRFTLAADVTVAEDGPRQAARTRVAAELEAAPGVVLRATVADHRELRLGITLRGATSALHGGTARVDGERRYDFGALSVHRGEEPSALAGGRRVALVRAAGVLADESLGGGAVLGGPSTTSSRPLHAQLERALEDPRTRGVLLDLRGVAGMAQLEELRPRVQALRAAGKPVVAFLEYGGGRGDLYLASACDRVVTTEEADFMGLGLRGERRWYRTMLERFGVRVDRASIGRYKSAYREFSADSTPPADREVIEHVLDQSQALFVDALAEGRGVPAERFAHVLDGRAWPARDLVAAGLADTVAYREDALALLGRLTGLGARPRTVSLGRTPAAAREWTRRAPVAVVYAGGAIETGRSGGGLLSGDYMGSETVTRQLERAFKTPGVRAVVLRVESPGGSALASNLIDHAVQRLRRETGKPCIVSMGSVAASGGYYISAHADRIYADRFTRTGSIGVLYVKPSLEGFWARQHVRRDVFERGAYMGGLSGDVDWTPAFQAAADSAIRRNYDVFVGKVADGRKLPVEHVLDVAQGRVWLGADAFERKLVDQIGGLQSALADACMRAGVRPGEKIRLVEFRHPRGNLLERLAGGWVREMVATQLATSALAGVQYREPEGLGELLE